MNGNDTRPGLSFRVGDEAIEVAGYKKDGTLTLATYPHAEMIGEAYELTIEAAGMVYLIRLDAARNLEDLQKMLAERAKFDCGHDEGKG